MLKDKNKIGQSSQGAGGKPPTNARNMTDRAAGGQNKSRYPPKNLANYTKDYKKFTEDAHLPKSL